MSSVEVRAKIEALTEAKKINEILIKMHKKDLQTSALCKYIEWEKWHEGNISGLVIANRYLKREIKYLQCKVNCPF